MAHAARRGVAEGWRDGGTEGLRDEGLRDVTAKHPPLLGAGVGLDEPSAGTKAQIDGDPPRALGQLFAPHKVAIKAMNSIGAQS